MQKERMYIVGAGISGITASHYAAQHKYPCTLLENNSSVGGRAGSEVIDDFAYEYGGKNFNIRGRKTKELLESYDFQDFDSQHPNFPYLIGKKLYVLAKGKELPRTIMHLFLNSGIIGTSQFGNIMNYSMQNRKQIRYMSEFMYELEDKHDGRPLDKQISPKLANGALRLFSILFSGLEPNEISYSTLLASLADQQGQYVSIRGGAHVLFDRVLADKDLRLNTKVKHVLVENNKVTGLIAANGKGEERIATNKVVLAVPLYKLNDLLDLPEEVSKAVKAVQYSPLVLVVARYKQDVFNDKFSSLFFSSDFHLGHCAANRSYQKKLVRYTFSGRKGREVMGQDDASLVALAEKELSSVKKVTSGISLADNREHYKVYRYQQGVCAFKPYYSRTLKTITDYISTIEGLELTGDYINGPSMEMCMISSENAVRNLLN